MLMYNVYRSIRGSFNDKYTCWNIHFWNIWKKEHKNVKTIYNIFIGTRPKCSWPMFKLVPVVAQLAPVKLEGHIHEYPKPSSKSMQAPPFIQGDDKHAKSKTKRRYRWCESKRMLDRSYSKWKRLKLACAKHFFIIY